MEQGAFTADGCSVEVYRLLPPGDEPEIVHAAVPAGASILLGRVFDVVLLGSHLINTAAETDREAFLSAARAHVAPGGRVLVEWHPPEWFGSVRDGQGGRLGEVDVRLGQVVRDGDLLSAVVRYSAGARWWSQAFTCRRLDEQALKGALTSAGLVFERWHTEDRNWFSAHPE